MSLLKAVCGFEPPAHALSESLPCWAVSRGATVTQPPPWNVGASAQIYTCIRGDLKGNGRRDLLVELGSQLCDVVLVGCLPLRN